MSEPATEVSSEDNKPPEAPAEKVHDPIRRLTLIIVSIVSVLFVWYLLADRFTPFTDNARVRGYVLPLAASVSGRLVELPVVNNQVVEQGQVLARIERERYELDVRLAEAALELAGQEVGAQTAEISVAQAKVVEAQTTLKNIQFQAARILEVAKKGYVSAAEVDQAKTALANAKAAVESALAELESTKQSAGVAGRENPKVQKALAELGQARVNLEDTVLTAPRRGLVTNIRYDVGFFANPGQPLMTYISQRDVWVEGYLRENNLQHISPGDKVDIVLDSAPGQVFKGSVTSVSAGVQFDTASQVGSLQAPAQTTGWLRDAQRFPVVIQFDDDAAFGFRREGGQADIIVYTHERSALNWLGKIYIRLISWLSYVY